MKSFANFADAEKYGNEISKRDLKSIPILRKDNKFYVIENGNEYLIHAQFVFLIKNYIPKYRVIYRSKQSGIHDDGFPTLDDAIKFEKQIQTCNMFEDIKLRIIDENVYNSQYDSTESKIMREQYLTKLRNGDYTCI